MEHPWDVVRGIHIALEGGGGGGGVTCDVHAHVHAHVHVHVHVTCTGSPDGDYDLRRGVPSSSFVLRGRARESRIVVTGVVPLRASPVPSSLRENSFVFALGGIQKERKQTTHPASSLRVASAVRSAEFDFFCHR